MCMPKRKSVCTCVCGIDKEREKERKKERGREVRTKICMPNEREKVTKK